MTRDGMLQEYILPTRKRHHVDNDLYLTGKGVTIGFLDGGFLAHPDFLDPHNRIKAFHDVLNPGAQFSTKIVRDKSAMHGTAVAFAAVGKGPYGGLATESDIVLVDVGRDYVLKDDDIVAGFKWFLDNHSKYDIRVIVTACNASSRCLELNDMIDDLSSKGVAVIVAAGNGEGECLPPASASKAIVVGGYYDGGDGLSFSTYNHKTCKGKPTILAPAVNIPIPIFPEFEEAEIARRYSSGEVFLEEDVRRLRIISENYRLVDGTSLAAPFVGSVVAVMLQSNPSLTPDVIANILKETSSSGILRVDKALRNI